MDAETEEKVSGIETEEDVSVADDQGGQISEVGHLEFGHLKSPANEDILSLDGQGGQISEVGHLGSVYIRNAVKLERLIAALAPYQEIAIDVETYPRDEHNTALDPRRGTVRTISVAASDDVVGVIDARAVNPRPLLDSLSGRTLVAFNAQFDLSFIRRAFGYEHDRPVADPGVLDVVLKFAGKSGARERYKDKGRIKFGFDPRRKHFRSLVAVLEDFLPNFGELKKQEQGSDWGADTLTKEQVEYAAKDARILIPLIAAVRHRFEEAGMLRVYELENRFTPALAYTQDNGFGLGVDGWRERCARQEEKDLKNLKAACDDLAPDVPEDANFNEWAWNGSSHRRVGLALELLGAKVKKNSDTGNYLTGEAELEVIKEPEAAAKLVRAILTYREAQKQFSTWGMSWFDLPKFRPKAKKHPYDKDHQFIVDGRVYSRFNQTVKTGRLSSVSPNFQNIPPEVRSHFIAPPGRQLVIGDYKQLEYIVLAILTQEDVLIDGFRRGDDVHVRVAQTVFGIQGEVSKVDRKKAKEIGFGIVYGISSGGLATRLSRTTGTEFSKDDAQDLMDTYLDALPKVKLWYQTEKDLALSKNDVTKTMAGRERLLDLTLSKRGKWYVEPSLRLNTAVQGSASDGFKYATALAHESKDECPGSPMIVNMVHDELVIEVDEDHVGDATEWLEKCMIDGMAEV
ncbi:MAG TPA: DNA polymerase, partial [Pyrinomonadaceae bacterium]|nr:DNA polymerase [Pyrinomonadaceae bacterium]